MANGYPTTPTEVIERATLIVGRNANECKAHACRMGLKNYRICTQPKDVITLQSHNFVALVRVPDPQGREIILPATAWQLRKCFTQEALKKNPAAMVALQWLQKQANGGLSMAL